MTTIRLGATTNIRVVKDGEVIFDGPCSVEASTSNGTMTLTPVTLLPEEPTLYTVVHVPSLNSWQRWTRLDQPTGRNWVDNRAEWSSWEQVCALGTPEVLEPQSVKATREALRMQKALANTYKARAEKAEEMLAADEVTEEPVPGTHLVSRKTGDRWHRAMGCERWHNDTLGSNCDDWDSLLKHNGPMTLVTP